MKIDGANHVNLNLVTIAPFFFTVVPVCSPQTWDSFVPDTEQTHDSHFPQMQKRRTKPCSSSHLTVNLRRGAV